MNSIFYSEKNQARYKNWPEHPSPVFIFLQLREMVQRDKTIMVRRRK